MVCLRAILLTFINTIQASRRLSIDFLSRDLDVDHEVIYQLARLSPSLVLLSGDKSHVIARYDSLPNICFLI